MTKVLVVDDDPQIVRAVVINLRARAYEVDAAGTGAEALARAARCPPDLVVLDLGLPDLSGLDVIRGLRGWTPVPIIVLSARHGSIDKVEALDAGADDYVTKPFGMEELLARLRAASRRASPVAALPAVTTAAFTVDLAAKRAITAAGPVHLTPTEWGLLEVLARNAGKLVTARQMLAEVWGPGYLQQTHYVRLYVAQLRRKLEPVPSRPRYLLTEPGMGYRLQGDPAGGGQPAEHGAPERTGGAESNALWT